MQSGKREIQLFPEKVQSEKRRLKNPKGCKYLERSWGRRNQKERLKLNLPSAGEPGERSIFTIRKKVPKKQEE